MPKRAAPRAQYKLCRTGIHETHANIPNIMKGARIAIKIPHPVVKSLRVNKAYKVSAITIASINQ